eukprot:560357-Prorocentrum_minimum.AAC.2
MKAIGDCIRQSWFVTMYIPGNDVAGGVPAAAGRARGDHRQRRERVVGCLVPLLAAPLAPPPEGELEARARDRLRDEGVGRAPACAHAREDPPHGGVRAAPPVRQRAQDGAVRHGVHHEGLVPFAMLQQLVVRSGGLPVAAALAEDTDELGVRDDVLLDPDPPHAPDHRPGQPPLAVERKLLEELVEHLHVGHAFPPLQARRNLRRARATSFTSDCGIRSAAGRSGTASADSSPEASSDPDSIDLANCRGLDR